MNKELTKDAKDKILKIIKESSHNGLIKAK